MADIIRLGDRFINLDNFSHSCPNADGQVIYMNNGRLMLSPQEAQLFMNAVTDKSRAVMPVAKAPRNRHAALANSGRRGK